MFARQYPQFVKSLTLLSVAAQPAKTWHVNYYQQRQIYTLSKAEALLNTLHNVFRDKFPCCLRNLIDHFYRDLDNLPLMHSLLQIQQLPLEKVSMPLMVCSGQIDMILGYADLHEWKKWLKPEDILWKCHQGGHFFPLFLSRNSQPADITFLAIAPIKRTTKRCCNYLTFKKSYLLFYSVILATTPQ